MRQWKRARKHYSGGRAAVLTNEFPLSRGGKVDANFFFSLAGRRRLQFVTRKPRPRHLSAPSSGGGGVRTGRKALGGTLKQQQACARTDEPRARKRDDAESFDAARSGSDRRLTREPTRRSEKAEARAASAHIPVLAGLPTPYANLNSDRSAALLLLLQHRENLFQEPPSNCPDGLRDIFALFNTDSPSSWIF